MLCSTSFRRSLFLVVRPRGRSGRNLNPPYLGVKTNRNGQQEKKSSSKQNKPIDLIHKKHIKYPSNQPFERLSSASR